MSAPTHVCTLPWWLDEYGRICGTDGTAEKVARYAAGALAAGLSVEITTRDYSDRDGRTLFAIRTVKR